MDLLRTQMSFKKKKEKKIFKICLKETITLSIIYEKMKCISTFGIVTAPRSGWAANLLEIVNLEETVNLDS